MRLEFFGRALVALSLVACGGSWSSVGAPDASDDSQPQESAEPDAADGMAADSGAADVATAPSDAETGVPPSTPIALADAWVAGFYGTAYEGINAYSNTDSPGLPNGYYAQWRGDPGVSMFANVSDCSSFSDILLSRSYGWTPPTTNPRPLAEDYYWAIRGGNGFAPIANVNDIQAGDVIALLYPPGGTYTGHVAWIDARPQPFSGAPQEPGLSQFVVTVIDSDNGFHDGPSGPSTAADGRYLGRLSDGSQCTTDTQCITMCGPNAVCDTTSLISDSVCALTGVGRGQMRLFADSTGTIQGHTWSPNTESVFYPRPSPPPVQGGTFTGEDIVVGRYNRP
jgi:hypothetical protein